MTLRETTPLSQKGQEIMTMLKAANFIVRTNIGKKRESFYFQDKTQRDTAYDHLTKVLDPNAYKLIQHGDTTFYINTAEPEQANQKKVKAKKAAASVVSTTDPKGKYPSANDINAVAQFLREKGFGVNKVKEQNKTLYLVKKKEQRKAITSAKKQGFNIEPRGASGIGIVTNIAIDKRKANDIYAVREFLRQNGHPANVTDPNGKAFVLVHKSKQAEAVKLALDAGFNVEARGIGSIGIVRNRKAKPKAVFKKQPKKQSITSVSKSKFVSAGRVARGFSISSKAIVDMVMSNPDNGEQQQLVRLLMERVGINEAMDLSKVSNEDLQQEIARRLK